MKTGIVIPVRTTSRRLPMKHFYPIWKTITALECLTTRMRQLGLPVILAPPIEQHQIFAVWSFRLGVQMSSFNVKEWEVTKRIYKVAVAHRLDQLILVNGDSPLMCPRVVNACLKKVNGAEIIYNVAPAGQRVLISPTEVFEDWLEHLDDNQEHPFLALKEKHDVKFTRVRAVDRDGPGLTLDTYRDLRFLQRLCDEVGGIGGTAEEYLKAAAALSRGANYRQEESGSHTGEHLLPEGS